MFLIVLVLTYNEQDDLHNRKSSSQKGASLGLKTLIVFANLHFCMEILA